MYINVLYNQIYLFKKDYSNDLGKLNNWNGETKYNVFKISNEISINWRLPIQYRSEVNWSNVIMMLILHWLSIGLNSPLKF